MVYNPLLQDIVSFGGKALIARELAKGAAPVNPIMSQADLESSANRQARYGQQALDYSLRKSQPDQYTPGGRLVYDPQNDRLITTLSPREQAIFDQEQRARYNYGRLAAGQEQSLYDMVREPLDTSGLTPRGDIRNAPLPDLQGFSGANQERDRVYDDVMGRFISGQPLPPQQYGGPQGSNYRYSQPAPQSSPQGGISDYDSGMAAFDRLPTGTPLVTSVPAPALPAPMTAAEGGWPDKSEYAGGGTSPWNSFIGNLLGTSEGQKLLASGWDAITDAWKAWQGTEATAVPTATVPPPPPIPEPRPVAPQPLQTTPIPEPRPVLPEPPRSVLPEPPRSVQPVAPRPVQPVAPRPVLPEPPRSVQPVAPRPVLPEPPRSVAQRPVQPVAQRPVQPVQRPVLPEPPRPVAQRPVGNPLLTSGFSTQPVTPAKPSPRPAFAPAGMDADGTPQGIDVSAPRPVFGPPMPEPQEQGVTGTYDEAIANRKPYSKPIQAGIESFMNQGSGSSGFSHPAFSKRGPAAPTTPAEIALKQRDDEVANRGFRVAQIARGELPLGQYRGQEASDPRQRTLGVDIKQEEYDQMLSELGFPPERMSGSDPRPGYDRTEATQPSQYGLLGQLPSAGNIARDFGATGSMTDPTGAYLANYEEEILKPMHRRLLNERKQEENSLLRRGIGPDSSLWKRNENAFNQRMDNARLAANREAFSRGFQVQGRDWQQALGRGQFANQAQQQAYEQVLGRGQFGLQGQGQQYGQDAGRADMAGRTQQADYERQRGIDTYNTRIAQQNFENQQARMAGLTGQRAGELQERFGLRTGRLNEQLTLSNRNQVNMPQFQSPPQGSYSAPDLLGYEQERNTQNQFNTNRGDSQRRDMYNTFGRTARWFGGGGGGNKNNSWW